MAKSIILENLKVVVKDAATQDIISQLDLYSFNFAADGNGNCILSDGKESVKVEHATSYDSEGELLGSESALSDYLSSLLQDSVNIGRSLKLDNMELSNTGSQVKILNTNTGEQSFMVQQRVTSQGTNKVYYKEQTDEAVQENSSNAYQSLKVHTLTSTLNAQGRYVMAIDFTSNNNVFIKEYRSESIADANGDGIKNLNVKIFNVTTNPDDESKYRTLSGVGIDEGWHISKKAYWKLKEQHKIDSVEGDNIDAGVFAFPFAQGFSFEAGQSYRMVVSADNEFKLYGVDGAPNPFGGTQSIPYVERTYIGESEINVLTDAAIVHSGTIDFFRDETNTNITTSLGDSYNVNSVHAISDNGTIKLTHSNGVKEYYKNINHEYVTIAGESIAGGVGEVVNALNALFTVTQGQLSTSITSPQVDATGVATVNNNYTNIIDPVGDASFALSSGTHGTVYTDERINESGENFTFSIIGKNYHGIGLFDDTIDSDGNGTSDHLEELQSQTTSRNLGNQFSMWIHPTVAVWTYYGQNTGFAYLEGYGSSDTSIRFQTSTEYLNLATTPVGMKVGINNLGYLEVSYWNVGENRYIPLVRTSYVLANRNYGLYYAMGNTASQMWDAPKVHLIDESAPILTYYTIQSTDWKSPLFTTAEQANYYDSQNGGAGTSTINVFSDDATQTQWYAPDNGYTSNGVSQPSNTQDITYNVIPSETLVPIAFANTTYEINEGETFNIPIDPADHNWNTYVNGESWANLNGANLEGTAPQVTGDNVANPNDEYTFTVTRTLEESSQGTLTIRVINLTAPVNPISGFNHVSGTTAMVDSDTLDDGSVVHVNTLVADAERFVIEQAYIETNILPNLTASGDQYIIGLHNTASDFSTLEIADFDAAIVWEYESSTSHTFKFYRDGSVVQNIVINSLTDAYYDYAIEADGTSAWLIACNINSIMNEPSPSDGGVFSHTYEVTNTEDVAPLQVHIAALNTTADISTTDIETIATPAAPVLTIVTPWNKAIDFSGNGQRLKQVSSATNVNAIRMGGSGTTVGYSNSTHTVSDSQGRPWGTSVIFQADLASMGSTETSQIWNSGDGSSTGKDNIYLEVKKNGDLFFGWGRKNYNANTVKCFIANIGGSANIGHWWGVSVISKGARFSAANATAANLADSFDIRIMSTNDSPSAWSTFSSNISNITNWNNGLTGAAMDRAVSGDFMVGGQGAGAYSGFKGKVASMVVTTLKLNTLIPDETELRLMITDPMKWLQDYKDGQSFRPCSSSSNSTFSLNSTASSSATQIWLMGDGTNDSYSNGIRNQVHPSEQNYGKLQLNSMVSNDIETVNIPVLT